MLSESGVYAMLVYHYCPENRHLRRWLTHHVVPMLRDGGGVASNQAPSLRLMEWAGGTLSLLHWRTGTMGSSKGYAVFARRRDIAAFADSDDTAELL